MRAAAVVVGGLLSGALLVAVPGTARADEPTVRTSDDTVTYADPSLAEEDTTRVTGVLREVVVDHAPAEHADDAAPATVIVTADGTHLPVALDTPEPGPVERGLTGSPVVAQLVDGPALEKALDGEPSGSVDVASARFTTTAAAAAPVAHRAYVAIVENSGGMDSTSVIESRVAKGLTWWAEESGASFTRERTVRYSSGAADRCGFGNVNALWSDAAAQFPGVDFRASGNHLVVVVDGGCSGTGVGTLGRSMSNGGSVLMTESASVFTATFAHEVGHNVGLSHANLESDEYWDLYSPMGLAISGSETTALDSEYRTQLGIEASGEVEVVPAGSTVTRTLAARGSTSGLRGLEVRVDGTSHWVEYRPGTGRDAQAYYPKEAGGSYVSRTDKYPQGVTVSTRTTGGTGSTSLRPRKDGSLRHGAWLAGQTYTAGDMTVKVDAVTTAGATVTVSNGGTPPPTVVAATPTVKGTPKVGEPLTVDPGAWTAGTSFAYQWLAEGAAVTGATSATFTPTAAHRGRRLAVRVVGTLSGHLPATSTSAPTAAVADGTLATSVPTVTGTPKVGSTLTALPGTWTVGTSFAHLWLADGVPISGATASTFTPTPAQRGKSIAVRVTGSQSGYASTSTTSSPTAAVAAGTLSAPTPTVSGTAKVGVRLTAAAGSWTSGSTLTYRWLADGVDIASATATTYTPTAADRGRRISVRVTGVRDGYETTSRTSAPTAAVADGTLTTATPRITGTVRVGRKLSVSRGTWTSGTSFTYQWLADGSRISGATKSTYTLPKKMKGKRITVAVTGRKTGYATVTRTSARTARVG